jgi:hypothetical protein
LHAVATFRALLTTTCLAAAELTRAGTPPITVAIAVTSGPTQLNARDATSHFHVVLQNTSDVPQRLWQEWNSWGYYSLSFELTDVAGKQWIVAKRRDMRWSRNSPTYETIEPGRQLIVDVYFGDAAQWEGFPLQKGRQPIVQMRAIYEVLESPESKSYGAWVGRVESSPVEVRFARWQ